jgi:GT2 family glycosyltransferase
LRRQTFRDFETVLVDNGSVDDSAAFVRDSYPEIRVVELGENRGFAGGVNAGIRVARGDYIALLNNDTEVDDAWLYRLSAAIEENPDVFFFASKLVNYYSRDLVDSAGDGMNLWRGPYKIGEKEPVGNYRERRYIFGACGGGGCYKRELFDRIGLFDEEFFAYFEDIDLSFRANWAGFRCLFVPDAVIYHKVGGTSDKSAKSRDFFDILRRRNFVFMVMKNYPAALLWRYLPGILCIHLLKFLYFLAKGRVRVAFRTQVEICKGAPGMLGKRRAIMASRQVTTAELAARCNPQAAGN